jgi:hypothetical protein
VFLPAGNYLLDTYFLHWDPVTGQTGHASGSITLDTPILAIEYTSTSMDNWDGTVGGLTGILYPTGLPQRGVEIFTGNPVAESIVFSTDRRSVSVNLYALPTETDQLRIIVVQSVPEPGTLSYIGSTLVLAAALARRVSSKKA